MGEMPLLVPVTRSVSASISCRTSSKSVNFLDLQCRNSAYSGKEGKNRDEDNGDNEEAKTIWPRGARERTQRRPWHPGMDWKRP